MSYWNYCVTVPSRLRELPELAKTILFETRTAPPFNNEETTTELELAAKRCLPPEKIIGDTGILVDTLLVSMMDYAADDAAKRYTACAIITAQSKGLLMIIAEIWFYYLFCPIIAAGRSQPVMIDSFTSNNGPKALLRLAERGNTIAFAELVAIRESYLCIATDVIDQWYPDDGEKEFCVARATYILPSTYIELTEIKFKNKAFTLDLLRAWSGLDVHANTTDVKNAIFFNLDDGSYFQQFSQYLVPLHEPNTYVMKSHFPRRVVKQSKITFGDPLDIGIPLPDPRYLALHASLSCIVFCSGVAQYHHAWVIAKRARGTDTSSEEEDEERGTERRRKTERGAASVGTGQGLGRASGRKRR